MNSVKNLAKGGWHPEGQKNSSSSSSSSGGGSGFKGIDQVRGWMGKGGGRNDPHERAANHQSTPLNQLRDPSSFGPPPKRTGTSGSLASPSSPTTQPIYQGSRLTASTGGLDAPLNRAQLDEDRRLKQEREDAQRMQQEEATAKPAGPYKTDTTGLSTAGLPPPPKFRGAAGGATSPPAQPALRAAPPSLPPRLPPRGLASPPPPSYDTTVETDPERGVMNQGALSRLGAAGVRVPGLDIGTSPASQPAPAPSMGHGRQMSELQSRFSRLNSGSSNASADATPAATGGGTTWAQKQAALRTASDFQKDPSSVSLSDARSSASTANNFRERHGEQVASGWKAASGLNAKYGISDKINGGAATSSNAATEGQEVGVVGKKKPPPPPPAKRFGLGGSGQPSSPPPINFGTKPGS